MTGCRSRRSNNAIQGIDMNMFNVNVDSLVKEQLPLDELNGIVYIANVNCTKCVLQLFEYLDEISGMSMYDQLFLAANDTVMLNNLLQEEYDSPDSIKGKFQVIKIKDKIAAVQCNGVIVKKSPQGDEFLCEKYQPGYLNKLFNH